MCCIMREYDRSGCTHLSACYGPMPAKCSYTNEYENLMQLSEMLPRAFVFISPSDHVDLGMQREWWKRA